jgi:hypothetical protein
MSQKHVRCGSDLFFLSCQSQGGGLALAGRDWLQSRLFLAFLVFLNITAQYSNE